MIPIRPPTFWATLDQPVPLRRRCGWCRVPMDALGVIGRHEAVSDGICPICEAKAHAEMDAHDARRVA